MTKGTRSVVGVILGFVAYRISVEFLAIAVAVLLGIAVGVAVWLLTAPRERVK
jgi:membrane glycosyltransferase